MTHLILQLSATEAKLAAAENRLSSIGSLGEGWLSQCLIIFVTDVDKMLLTNMHACLHLKKHLKFDEWASIFFIKKSK